MFKKQLEKIWGTVAQQVNAVGFVGQGTEKFTRSLPPSSQGEKVKARSNMIAYHLQTPKWQDMVIKWIKEVTLIKVTSQCSMELATLR